MEVEPLYGPLSPGEIRVFCFDSVADRAENSELSGKLMTINVEHRSSFSNGSNPSGFGYDALSYPWGDTTVKHPILCGGRTIHIHANLYDALLAVRAQGTGRPIWTDAICIDQSDHREKMAQIQFMATIYQSSQQVWAWLGNAVEGTEEAVSKLSLVGQIAQELRDEGFLGRISDRRLPPPDSPFWSALEGIVYSEYFDRLWVLQEAALAKRVMFLCGRHQINWAQLEKLFSSPLYATLIQIIEFQRPFSRMLNTTVFETRKFVQGHDFQSLSRRLTKNSSSIPPRLLEDIQQCHDLYATIQKLQSCVLDRVLRLSMAQSCTEAKDRIFGIFGLLPFKHGANGGYPWTGEQSVEELYIETFYFLAKMGPKIGEVVPSYEQIPATGASPISSTDLPPSASDLTTSSLEMLSFAPPCPRSKLSLPTWCPDFHLIGNFRNNQTRFGEMLQDWQASARKQKIARGASIRQLKLQGVRVGHIKYIIPESWKARSLSWDNEAEIRMVASANLEWFHQCLALACGDERRPHEINMEPAANLCLCDDGDRLPDSFWRAMLVEEFRINGEANLTLTDFQNTLQLLHRLASPTSNIAEELAMLPEISKEPRIPRVLSLLMVMDLSLRDRVFFGTENGVFGLARQTVQVGDTLCVFHAARVPHVLRRFTTLTPGEGSGEQLWTFTGEAYAHDIMHGEAEVGLDGKFIDAETFTLI